MKTRTFSFIGLAAVLLIALAGAAAAGPLSPDKATGDTLPDVVRQATQAYKDVEAAKAAGYGLFLGCVSGPEGGAMGVHFPNGNLVGDGALDAMQPDILVYEPKNGKLELVAVEYLVLADQWDAAHQAPPTLMGHVFNRTGSPNRYGMPAFYELHVWAWKANPDGIFADFNRKVSCETYSG